MPARKYHFRVYSDQFIPYMRDALPPDVEVKEFNPNKGIPKECLNADGLFIRTVTPVNPKSTPWMDSPGRKLGFIATATSGTDHMDIPWLESLGIKVVSAPGCNAMAVAEYVASGILHWCDLHTEHPLGVRVGVIGVGHTGQKVSKLLNLFGFTCLEYDPPRALRDPSFKSCSWEDLKQARIWTIHTPLVTDGDYPTAGMIHKGVKTPDLLVNAARGGIVIEEEVSPTTDMIVDVWENEPRYSSETAARAHICTPHIAGYSIQGKINATSFVAFEFCDHIGKNPVIATPETSEPVSTSDQEEYTFLLSDDEEWPTSFDVDFDLDMSEFYEGSDLDEEDVEELDEEELAEYLDYLETKTFRVDLGDLIRISASTLLDKLLSNPVPSTLAEALERVHPMFETSSSMKILTQLPDEERASGFREIRSRYPLRDEYRFTKVPWPWLVRYPQLSYFGCTTNEDPSDWGE